jgi:thymidylate kinase
MMLTGVTPFGTEERLVLKPHAYPGRLITFCGIDGSGKSTMVDFTARYLETAHISHFKTYTPTELIRNNPVFRTLVDASSEEARVRVDVLGMCLQITGDLFQHLKDTIVPGLQAGEVVLCDRYVFTSLGEIRARTEDREIEHLFAQLAARMPQPDIAIALDVSPRVAEHRVRLRESERHKLIDRQFLTRQAYSYTQVALENDLLRISTEQPIETAFVQVKRRLDFLLAERGR